MTQRAGYGHQNETPAQAKQPTPRQQREQPVRNRLGLRHITLFRDADGTCYKAVIAGSCFTWVEVATAEFEAANEAITQR